MVKTLHLTAEGAGSVSCYGSRIPRACGTSKKKKKKKLKMTHIDGKIYYVLGLEELMLK